MARRRRTRRRGGPARRRHLARPARYLSQHVRRQRHPRAAAYLSRGSQAGRRRILRRRRCRVHRPASAAFGLLRSLRRGVRRVPRSVSARRLARLSRRCRAARMGREPCHPFRRCRAARPCPARGAFARGAGVRLVRTAPFSQPLVPRNACGRNPARRPRRRRSRGRGGPPAGGARRERARSDAARRRGLALCGGAVPRPPARDGAGRASQHFRRDGLRRASRCRAVRRFPPRAAGADGFAVALGGRPMNSVTDPAVAWVDRAIGLLERVPYWLLALPLRLGAAAVFWNSAQTKLANWDTTLELFADEHKLPLLPPEIAGHVALGIEVTTPGLVVLGLFTRAAALVLLAMTTVIEIFVYPLAWPTHIQWAAMLLVLLCRGPGKLSLDHLLWPPIRARLGAPPKA